MKPYLRLPAIIGVIGASTLATNLAVAVTKAPAERPQIVQSYDGVARGISDARDLKSEQK
jgi:hypothetical protein